MHVGLATTFQNPHNRTPDQEVYQNELRLTDLADPLGFQSIWSVEHHFTDYTMVPDVLQFLAWVAARTTRVQIGSMVVVLPWHDPLRVAESVAMLDNLSGGRFILGLGRGLARVEFEGFRVPMDESRGRFRESAELLLQGLEQGFCEYDGRYYRQPRRDLRPAPLKSFKGRTYCATVSPDSMQVVAELGLGLLILPQKPWDVMIPELAVYRDAFRTHHGVDAPPPIVSTFTVCHQDPGRARELAERHLRIYHDAMLRHYEIGVEHFADIQGYEYYAKMSQMLNKVGQDKAAEFFLSLQVFGTPEQCLEQILDLRAKSGCDRYTAQFSFGGMPYDDVERSMRLFAAKVLPALQQIPVGAAPVD